MKRSILFLRGLALLLFLSAPALADVDVCAQEAQWTRSDSQRHFMVLAGRTEVFYERSGPTFVMMIKSGSDESELGAFGIYATPDKHPAFGAVPASEYERFLQEPGKDSEVMLRVEISGPAYDRAVKILQSWDRRVRERALLYPDIALDNILLVKQATEELNRCSKTLNSYELDWGLEDAISEHNTALRIPFEYFKELKRRNSAKHVPDSAMPAALLTSVAAVQRATRPN
jgi:hypothetical protein